jgi:hypothetical protein
MAGDLSLPTEGLYEDAKKAIVWIVGPLFRPVKTRWQRRSILSTFAPAFADHCPEVTDLVDYFGWHTSAHDWTTGKGVLIAATYGELLCFWTSPERFVNYEAHLLRFISGGGETRRVFLLGPDLADTVRLWALQRTLLRHHELGFKPRVCSNLDLQTQKDDLRVKCDMCGVLNGRFAYFFRFSDELGPLMVRTTDPDTVNRAENAVNSLWKGSESFEDWYTRQPYDLPEELRLQIDRDIAAVRNVAGVDKDDDE